MNDLQRVKECIILTAIYYGRKDLSAPVLAMMADDLVGYPADSVIAAYQAYRKNGKNRVFPLPAQIIEMLEAHTRPNPNAIVTNLIAAVKRHDYTWPLQLNKSAYQTGSFQGDFIAELGTLAWQVVEMHGGWGRFCESYWNQSKNETSFRAQLRDLIEDVADNRQSADLLPFTRKPELAPPPKDDGPTHILSILFDDKTQSDKGAK
jgi:hypothetical protein